MIELLLSGAEQRTFIDRDLGTFPASRPRGRERAFRNARQNFDDAQRALTTSTCWPIMRPGERDLVSEGSSGG